MVQQGMNAENAMHLPSLELPRRHDVRPAADVDTRYLDKILVKTYPARFSFAHGGKDGHPYPVDRETYDRTIEVLRRSLDRGRLDHSEKVAALKRLATFSARAQALARGRGRDAAAHP